MSLFLRRSARIIDDSIRIADGTITITSEDDCIHADSSDDEDSDRQDLVIYADGSMEVINESDVSAQTLLDDGAQQSKDLFSGVLRTASPSFRNGYLFP